MHLECWASRERSTLVCRAPSFCSREELGSTTGLPINIWWWLTDFQIVPKGASNSWLSIHCSSLKGCSRNLWCVNSLARNQRENGLGRGRKLLQMIPANPVKMSFPPLGLFDASPCKLKKTQEKNMESRGWGVPGSSGTLAVIWWLITGNLLSCLWDLPPLRLCAINPFDSL